MTFSSFPWEGRSYDYVVTVCSKEAADRCPVFPGRSTRVQWFYPDPSTFTGTDQEIMSQVREVRDAIREKIQEFIGKVRTDA